ncbi:hypothetical protein FOXG_20821 [Fusarium oxysporum f. sp. lycopersici 4287]|uniref:Uncharacterized protein n=7 Tax=Fusarium oxysporum TaxID=5507 RepID=W9HYZ5_FUSOX|nr:hypothetical protein FOXG_20821 [Fusarium oxysporum f. sp. lycopersici 4287]EWY85989.1 hypothetical protein FOYG_10653 [Fusarium oxysporum NRRL 32931]EWZ94193.1 hypothetical protein FOWG_04560 [Fusarium oxysporum f. sp. lycopersici MN25]EXK38377.1 hypothetical protein FOMG_08775 [Fusarium oxysporum f. sp. melonis 26406]EXM26046.1 hypothetical protein FOTG_07705 [Fusarium oxysporum f. sp. vasinfectum 25433]KNB13459.1 hypothetical protein FOXG_20821 [Fusarium oxysporum f. sp. lycopersici 4287
MQPQKLHLFQTSITMEAISWDDGYPNYKGWVRCGCHYVQPDWEQERGCVHKDCDGGFYGSDGGFWIDWEYEDTTKRRWYCSRKCAKWTAKKMCVCTDRSCLCSR